MFSSGSGELNNVPVCMFISLVQRDLLSFPKKKSGICHPTVGSFLILNFPGTSYERVIVVWHSRTYDEGFSAYSMKVRIKFH